MQVKIREHVGENAMTLGDGEVIHQLIHDPLWNGETVELDFEGVEVKTPSFFTASIGCLLADIPPEELNERLILKQLSAWDDHLLRTVIENAKAFYVTWNSRQFPDYDPAISGVISEWDKGKNSFTLRETPDGRDRLCYFPVAYFDEVKKAFNSGHRVSVLGKETRETWVIEVAMISRESATDEQISADYHNPRDTTKDSH